MAQSTRRQLVFSTASAATGLLASTFRPWRASAAETGASPTSPPAPVGPGWPTQADELAREMVGASHARVDRVRELLAKNPSLARASWDWGFGDWETALGAASHVGNREIAGLLLERGVPPTLFSATMLGQLDVVRAFVAASPGVQKTPGPHGLTLLHHARAGGDGAKAVLQYLEALGGADQKPAWQPISEADAAALHGFYRFGPGETETIRIFANRIGLAFERAGTSERLLFHLGNFEFHTPGVVEARVRFERESAAAGSRFVALTIHDPDLVVRAVRIG